MKTCWLFLSFFLLHVASWAQTISPPVNLGFEQVDARSGRPIGWQVGDGNGSYQAVADSLVHQEGHYSLRLATVGSSRSTKSYGFAMQQIPVTFRGKELKFSAYLKTSNVTQGYAGLLLRVDGTQGQLAFDNMSKQPVRGTTDWQQYTVTLPLAAEARTIYFGSILPAKGTLWLDRLALTVDGKPLAQALPIPVEHFKAEQDTAFRRGSGIVFGQLSKQQLDNLAVLGRVWGFAKYYHPAVARGDYNWDAELLRVLPRVLATTTLADRSQVLSTWLTNLGPIPACTTCQEPAPGSMRLQADLDWLTDTKQLSPALSQQLVYLRQNRNQGPHYYVAATPRVGNPIFQHEETYAASATPDAGLRLLALYRYWNMVDYYFPYRYAIGEDWQRVLPEFIPEFIAASTAEQYQLALLRLAARLHDTHAALSSPVLQHYWGTYYAPVQVRFVENQAVVTAYFNDALGTASGLQKGDVVLRVNGVKVADLVKAHQPLTPASNEPVQLRNIAQILLRGNTTQLAVVVRRSGRELPLTLTRYPASQLNLAINSGTPDPKAPAWRLLPGNIGHLVLGTIHDNEVSNIMKAAKDTKGLIVDLRNYPADFVVYSLVSYLLSKPTSFVKFSQLSTTYPGVFEAGPELTIPAAQSTPSYAGKVLILVNELTQSSAEFHAMALRAVPGALVLGSTTAGADGNVSAIVLPGNVTTRFTGIGVFYPDGRETQRIGIVPDVEVKPTIKGISEGHDEVLEKAVQLIKAG
jgi:C-terminal processing protease CtpA/Prc